MTKNYSAAAISLGDKTKSTARNHGLDVNTFASGHVAERIGTEFPTNLPYKVKGGVQFAQNLRQTSDIDIVTIRRISNREMQNAFKVLAPFLEREGIVIHSLSREPQELDVGLPNPVDRWKIEATCGTVRANTSIDLTWENGSDSIWAGCGPRARFIERPSLIKGAPAFRAAVQHPAEAAGERILAVLMQPSTDARCKYLLDVVNGNLWPDDLYCRDVAKAMYRTMRYRSIPTDIVTEHPDVLSWKALSRLEADWNKSANAKRSGLRFDEAFVDFHAIYAGVHGEFKNDIGRHFRRPTPQPTLVERLVTSKPPAPTYSPKF